MSGENTQKSALNEKHIATINNISQLQEVERYMFENLQELNNEGNDARAEAIKSRINELKAIRITLFNDLKEDYNKSVNDSASYNTVGDYSTKMGTVLSKELYDVENRIEKLKASKSNKERLVRLGEYEYDRYESHTEILKILVYCSLFILFFIFIKKFEFIPNIISQLGIVIVISFTIYNIISKLYWNLRRNNIDYQKFEQWYGPDTGYDDQGSNFSGKKIFNELFGDLCEAGEENDDLAEDSE